ncbi:Ribosome-recycling factor [Morus notabilis]|uniref:Ribosome-recycling factor, chloroplastic n=1 Tax=Morus notabilis TaxID=981085 RepID=W9SAR3_9ROSA|nr:Ribosome-recycling factor [Morus notabilis]
MAIFIRRAFSYRNVLLLRSSQHLISSTNGRLCSSSNTHNTLSPPNLDFLRDTRRGFAKGRKSKEDSGSSSTIVELPDLGPTIKSNVTSQMDSAIAALSTELSKLRTGRASSGMLDHIMVDLGDVKLPLNQIAVVSVIDSKTLSVNPFDPSALKSLEKAIISSPLGLSPKVDGERLIAVIPPLTQEHIQFLRYLISRNICQAVCKVVMKSCEDAKQSIRRARQRAMDTIKKMQSSYPKDDIKRLEKEVEELTKKFTKTAEDLCKAKEKENKS